MSSNFIVHSFIGRKLILIVKHKVYCIVFKMPVSTKVEITPFSKKDIEEYEKIGSEVNEYIFVGPRRYVLTATYGAHMDAILNMPLRPTDVFVVSYPRSGTTWTQELVWLLVNDLDFVKAKSTPLVQRFPYLEEFTLFTPEAVKSLEANAKDDEELQHVRALVTPAYETLARAPSPRFIKSHLPLSLLPATTLDSAKVVYVARDPRDVAVSLYNFYNAIPMYKMKCTFKEYFMKIISTNLVPESPISEHIKEAWAKRHHPNLLFIFYEELYKDLQGTARRVASFLGKQYSEDQLYQLCQHLDFANFQKNSSVDLKHFKDMGLLENKENNFVRKGKVGGWRECFDEEMMQRFESWMEESLKGTDLRFLQ